MDSLSGYTFADLYAMLQWKNVDVIEWLQGLQLLHFYQICDCGEVMRQRNVRDGQSYGKWQCPAKKCRKERGFLVGTWFEGMHLSLKEVSLLFQPFLVFRSYNFCISGALIWLIICLSNFKCVVQMVLLLAQQQSSISKNFFVVHA